MHYAGWKHHVSLYPLPAGDEQLRRDLAPFVAGKGTARFPLREPLPHELIERVVQELLDERRRTDAGSGMRTPPPRKRLER